jgi:hypothetical protein
MRRTLADISITRLQDDYLDHYASLGVSVTPEASIAIRDDRDANTLEVSERYRMTYAWEPLGDGTEEFWLPPATIFDWLPGVASARAYPLALPVGLDEHEQITVLADPDWELEEVEAEVQSPWFHFTAVSTPQDDGMLLDYNLRVLADRVPPHELSAYQAALQDMHDARGYALVRGETGWAIPWDMIESVLAFLVAIFAVLVAVPVSVFAAAVLVWFGMPRRAIKTS